MTLVAFTIPDDPAALPGWLERRLLATDFGRFVAELSAAYPERSRSKLPARQLLGDWYRSALADGLKAVPAGVIRQLLRHPTCLLELQEAVLTEGGPYWDDVADTVAEPLPAFDHGMAALEAAFQATPSRPPVPASPRRESGETTPGTPRASRSYLTWAVVSSALAACLLVAVGFLTLRGNRPGQTDVAVASWGWGKAGGIPQDKPTRGEYLNGLADVAGEWLDKRPESAPDVARRVGEFRAGCTRLILASHTPLDAKDKEWLVGKCRDWAKKLDDQLTALEGGADPVKVRGDTDELVRKLQSALRDRATSAS